jgi:transposase
MAHPLPLELRNRAIEAYSAGLSTYEEVAQRFAVGEASVKRWMALFRRTGSAAPLPHGGGNPPRIGEEGKKILSELVTQASDATLAELAEAYTKQTEQRVGRSVMSRALEKLGLTRKKRPFERANRTKKKQRSDAKFT